MIKLKNGFEIEYSKDFDVFFKNLLEAIITESKKTAGEEKENVDNLSINELLLKELMDNCIFVTNQLFELAEKNRDLSKFMVTGFLFNSIILNMPFIEDDSVNGDATTLH